MIMLDTNTVARKTSDPTMKATNEKKTAPLKVPKTTNPSPDAPDSYKRFKISFSGNAMRSLQGSRYFWVKG